MRKLFVVACALIFIGVGCGTDQEPLPPPEVHTSSTVQSTTSSSSSIGKNEKNETLRLLAEARQKINVNDNQILSYQLFKGYAILVFTIIADKDLYSESPDEAETVLYAYNLVDRTVNRLVSSKELPKSSVLDFESGKTVLGGFRNLVVDGGTLSSNGRYLQLWTLDIVFGEPSGQHTILVDLVNKKAKNIGSTSGFEWLAEGKYRYKPVTEYKDPTCEQEVGPPICTKEGPWTTGAI